MRKVQQAKILGLLQTLKEATGELEKQASPEVLCELLADIQGFTLQMGQYIESVAGEETETVRLLEDFCGTLYSAYNDKSVVSYAQQLKSQIMSIKHTVESELKPNRIEVVFFPYQRSMWDSLESVYLAAKADPNCDAYVVAIPWFEKLPNGKFGQMHYDGDQYPEHIPITNWQEYDVEARCPDIIYIHNSYDEKNYVTSVHPGFYSKRLRHYTDLLVYIPYFVGIGEVQESFSTVEACIYAHKTIVQSEKVRADYIKVFEKNFGNRFGNPRDRFVALGSPKYDAVVNSRPEDFVLPKIWRTLLYNSDGTKKKAVLYNSTVSAILQGDEQYLKKMRYVLGIFKERNDVVLWWRPHPLNEVTYQAMHPQLLEEYHQIISEYKRAGWGIYDDTPELNRAIAWTDACHSDISSLVSLYQAAGKPVLVQNVEIVDADGALLDKAHFQYVCDTEGEYWFSDRRLNMLARISKSNWTPQYVGHFPHEKEHLDNGALYIQIAPLAEHLYFAPSATQAIATYSIKEREFSRIPFLNKNEPPTGKYFHGAIAYEGSVFFTPYLYPGIMCLDGETGSIAYYNDWVEPLEKRIGAVKDAYFIVPLYTGNSSIMLAACGTNAVVEFHLDTRTSQIHSVGRSNYRYNSICFDGEDYWLAPRHNTPVIKWNPHTGKVEEFPNLYLDDGETTFNFCPIVYCCGHVWLLPHLAKHAVKINVHTSAVSIAEELEIPTGKKDGMGLAPRYSFSQVCGENIVAYDERNAAFVEYNPAAKTLKKGSLRYPQDVLTRLQPVFDQVFLPEPSTLKTEYDCYFTEGNLASLTSFLRFLTNESSCDAAIRVAEKRVEIVQSTNTNADGTAGKSIYKFSKNTIEWK